MEENRKVQIKNFMKKGFDIDIDDKYIEDYNQALTHYNDDRPKGTREPERLAFLGDAYLEFIVREYLFSHKDNFSLEKMNDLKKPLVENDKGWKKIAEEIGLDEQIVTVQHDKRIEDKIEDRTILARSFEALAAVLSYDSRDDPKEKLIDLFIKLGYLSK
jgi:dsRNA-specific ribonuclease